MKIRDIDQLRCFNSIFETKSLTKTASRMNISKAAVTKRLASLEEQLGCKLFLRSTRQITPTSEGLDFYQRSKPLLDSISEFELVVSQESSLKGNIRITCPASMAQNFLGKELVHFQKKHAGINIELIVTDSILDLVEQNIDLAIRVNPSKNSQLVGKKLTDLSLKVVATPGYLKKKEPIKKLEDLKKHLVYYSEAHKNISFHSTKMKLKDLAFNRAFVTNDSTLMTKLTLSGLGIGIRSSWDIKDSLKKGHLKEILPQSPLETLGEVWLLSSSGRMQTKRVRLLFDFLLERLPIFL
jgi:LysR family transcriptional regulator, transcriptional activator for dmlA